MALLQISEPGQSPEPHQQRLAVGIDLGTTNSLVATVRSGVRHGAARRAGPRAAALDRALPARRQVEVGYAAQAHQADDPKNSIASVKRFMGRGLKDVAHAENAPYDFVDAPGMVQLKTVAGVKSPVEVSAEILKTLRTRAEKSLNGDLAGAVITVPAYFDDAQRQATKDAARLAGPERAAPAERADRRGDRLRAGQRAPRAPTRCSTWAAAPSTSPSSSSPRACSRCSPPTATRRWAATTWTSACSAGSSRRRSSRRSSPRDMRLLLVKAREAKEYLTGHAEARITREAFLGRVRRRDARHRDLLPHHAAPGAEDARARAQGAARCGPARWRRSRAW